MCFGLARQWVLVLVCVCALQCCTQHPTCLLSPVSAAFHEALGDAIGLSVSTPRHLQRIGLLNNITDDYGEGAVLPGFLG